jgi:hypothetical protein
MPTTGLSWHTFKQQIPTEERYPLNTIPSIPITITSIVLIPKNSSIKLLLLICQPAQSSSAILYLQLGESRRKRRHLCAKRRRPGSHTKARWPLPGSWGRPGVHTRPWGRPGAHTGARGRPEAHTTKRTGTPVSR